MEQTLISDELASVTLVEDHYYGIKDICKLSLDSAFGSEQPNGNSDPLESTALSGGHADGVKWFHKSLDSIVGRRPTCVSAVDSFVTTCSSPVPSMSESRIRQRLIDIGFASPGPITRSTKRFYEKYLRAEEKHELLVGSPRERLAASRERIAPLAGYPQEINDLIGSDNRGGGDANRGHISELQLTHVVKLEGRLNACCASLTGRKNHFNYLLLEPTNCHQLVQLVETEPCRQLEAFATFVRSIFYIGKGQGNRSYAHLYEADAYKQMHASLCMASTSSCTARRRASKKVSRILAIWQSGRGVVSHPCFHSVTSAEALTREALMIAAVGKQNLTNVQRGKLKVELKMNEHTRRQLGSYLLYKAFRTFCIEGVREIRQQNVEK